MDTGGSPMNEDSSEVTSRRATWSFESRWASKFQQAENMDFTDDHDTWSLASYDSACSSDMDTLPHHHKSSLGRPFRSSLKDLTKIADSVHSLDHAVSPQSTPGLTRKAINPTVDLHTDLGGTDLKEKSRSGLSNSMILNWLAFKKYQQYPTIAENPESPRNSPVDESTMDSVITVVQGPGLTSAPSAEMNSASGKILEAATAFSPGLPNPNQPPNQLGPNIGIKRNFSMQDLGTPPEENPGIKRNFSFKDLNAVAPSYW